MKAKNLIICLVLWVLICPKGHVAYYLDYKPKKCDPVYFSDFHTNNRGYFYKGVMHILNWSPPIENQAARCPKCNTLLIFDNDHIKSMKGAE